MVKLKGLAVLVLACTMLGSCTVYSNALQRVVVTHVVTAGETLESIATDYLPANYPFPVFKESIVEMNYDSVFQYRNEVETGDCLIISYFAPTGK